MRGRSHVFRLLPVAFLLVVIPAVPTAAALPLDEDNDTLPDLAEVLVCGNELIRGFVNLSTIPGDCPSPIDYAAPSTAPYESFVAFLISTAFEYSQEGSNLSDGNADGVPDGVEFLACRVENKNYAIDGSCEGDDYALP